MRGVAALLRDTRPIQFGPRLLRPVLEAAAPRARLRTVSLSHSQSPSLTTHPTLISHTPTPSLPANASTSAPAPCQAPTRGISYALGSPENLLLPPPGLGPSPGTTCALPLPLAPARGTSGIATPAFSPASPTTQPAATGVAKPLPANASTSAPAPCQAPTCGISYALGSPANLLLPPPGLEPSPGTARVFSLPLAPARGTSSIATPAFSLASPTALSAFVGDAAARPAFFALAIAPAAALHSPAAQHYRAPP